MSDRRYTVLLRLGLLLVGLFIGILAMLLYVDQAPPTPQVVERVELGTPAPTRRGRLRPSWTPCRHPC